MPAMHGGFYVGHQTEVTPIGYQARNVGTNPVLEPNHNWDEPWRYRSECPTCGTVLKLHVTKEEAERHGRWHARMLAAIEMFLIGGTSVGIDNTRNVLALRAAKELGPIEYERILDEVKRRRREWVTQQTLWQRQWQSKTRRPSRARHHDSISIREKYVRCA